MENIKVGDIVANDSIYGLQLFFVHKIDGANLDRITTSGISDKAMIFPKSTGWYFDRKATEEEVEKFYFLLRANENRCKFDRNNGVRSIYEC